VKRVHQLGPQTIRVERRYGTDGIGAPRGVVTERPGGSLRPEEFVRLVNVDWLGNGIIPRPGQARLGTLIHDDEARTHPYDFRLGCATRLWHAGVGCPGQGLSGGFFIGHYDQEQEPQVQRAAYYSTSLNQIAIATYGGQPYIAIDDSLRRLQTIPVPYGEEQITIGGQGADLPSALLTGFRCNAMIEFDGLFFLALQENGSGTHKIATYDGVTLRDDLTGLADAPVAFGLWRDSLILGYVVGANRISVRARGASPGTWAHVSPGAGTIATQLGRNSIVSYKDEVYIADGGANVWNYDGTTLAVGRNVVGATITCVEEAFGYLFYGYLSSGGDATIGRYDNSSWVDAHRDLTADEPLAARVDALRYFRDALVVCVTRTGFQNALLESPGRNTASAWTGHVLQGGLPSSNQIYYMLVL
jgi:hypothetical protein